MRHKSAVRWLTGTAVALGAALTFPAHAGKTLDAMKQRGALVCGVNVGLAGFSAADSQGNWTGLDVDICKALAAAVLSDPNKVKWVPLTAQAAVYCAAVGRGRHPVAQHDLDADPRRVARPRFCGRHLLRRPGLHGAQEDEAHQRQESEGRRCLRAVRHHDREEPERLQQEQ